MVWAGLAGLLLSPGIGGADPSPGATTAAARATTSGTSPPLTVLAQTAWVAPGQSFDLKLKAGSGDPPASQLGVSVAVFPCLTSVSAFDQTVTSSSGPSGSPISATSSPLPVSSLAPVTGEIGGFDLPMAVSVGHSAPSPSPSSFAIDLTPAGQCQSSAGVYPVRVQLVNLTGGQVVGTITTHLVYADADATTQRLQFAAVLPLQVAVPPTRAPTATALRAHPSSALRSPPTASLAAVTGTIAAIDQNRTVPITLDVSPQTVATLMSSGHQSAATELAGLAATPTVHQFAATTFAPVNAAGLVDAGLTGELTQQVSTGTETLAAQNLRPATAPAAGAAPALGAWFADSGLDLDTLDQLQSDGYSQLVLPAASVASTPANGSSAEPFQLTTSHGAGMTAMATDGDVVARFTADPGDPVLAAHQLVAELAQIYYEKPNDDTPRAVVAEAPAGWSDSPAFVSALLGALANNPIIDAVTTSGLFGAFPSPGSCHTQCKLSGPVSGATLPAAAIRTQRARINGFAAAAPSAKEVSAQLGNLVLAGEADTLRPSQQAAVLHNTASAVDAQLTQLEVAGQPITLTSQRGRLPISIFSNATYPVNASLTLTSDKLLFADKDLTQYTEPVTLIPQHTNVIYVNVQTRVSGVFKVAITLHSPTGGLLLSSGQISVRSTATSVVGIVLSLGAVVVLVVWWIRTSRKRRALRRHDELEAAMAASAHP
jgi:hypothetical protein